MRLYTIGYEGFDIDRFLKALRSLKINAVVDVRFQSHSRKREFSKPALKAFLEKHGIEYFDYRELGTPLELRSKLKKTGEYETFFSEYRKILKTKKEELKKIQLLLEKRTIVIMCYERDHLKCHRSIVAEEIKKRISEVEIKALQF